MSIDALLPRIKAARERGAIVLLKWDGERKALCSTVVLLYAPQDFSWRRDTDDIAAALAEALAEFESLPPSAVGNVS